MIRRFATTALIAAIVAAPALAQTMAPGHPASTPAAKRLSAADRSFAHDAAAGSLAEVQLGKLAEQTASSGAVKDFSKQMVADHGKADRQLEVIAQREGIVLPTSPDAEQKVAYEWISKQTGAVFDRLYIRNAVDDHETAVALYNREIGSGENPALKQFARETLPVVQQHLRMAQAIETDMNRNAPVAGSRPPRSEASGSSLPPHAGKRGDNIADLLNREELNQIENH
jgi:putative membrane protein